MENMVTIFAASGEQVLNEGRLFFTTAREASVGFVKKTKGAGRELAEATSEAGTELVDTVRVEAKTCAQAVDTGREAVKRGARTIVSPRALEREVLIVARESMTRALDRVDLRLTVLSSPELPSGKTKAPIRGYDKLTAKDIVAKLPELTPAQVRAVHGYELATKKRATILKAASVRTA